MSDHPAVLFVCLGNICRSPLAEAALTLAAARLKLTLTIASAGTGGWHIGEAPDPRAQAVARAHGIEIGQYRGQQVAPEDFYRFSHIIAMDRQNLAALKAMKPADSPARLSLMLDHLDGRQGDSVADPYYGDERDFLRTWKEVSAATEALARHLAAS